MSSAQGSTSSGHAPPCPRCGGPSTHRFEASDRNRAVTRERFKYNRCRICGVVWLVSPPPSLADYYPGNYHDLLEGRELRKAALAEAPRLAAIARHSVPGRLVEVGPSQGVFASAAKAAGFDVLALEMDAACCRHLADVIGVEAVNTATPATVLPKLPPSRAVVMWHVIEHLPDPWAVLRAAADNLEPRGILALATPNPDSLQQRLFGARWLHVDAPRHLTLIPLSALKDEAGKLGLELLDATTSDTVGRGLNRLGWERSLLRPPTMRPNPRGAHSIGRLLSASMRPWEERHQRGAAYTATFRKS